MSGHKKMKNLFDSIGAILSVMGLWTNYNIFIKKQLIQSIGEGFFERFVACLTLTFFDMQSFIAISVGELVQSDVMLDWGYKVASMGNSNARGTIFFTIGMGLLLLSRFIDEDNSKKSAN